MWKNAEDAMMDAGAKSKLLDCDIVMAGGVTSGIIYPGAVAMIARRYVFRSIGGTSVGAIAAAVTAAAEYGRQSGRNPASFEQIGVLPTSLGDPADDGHTRLFHLFTPEPSTRPLLALVAPIFAGGGSAAKFIGVLKASISHWEIRLAVVVALLAGLVVTLWLVLTGSYVLSIVALGMTAAFCLVVWGVVAGIILVKRWLPAWRKNGYGICTGLATPECEKSGDQAKFEGLTNWMNRVVQAAAGRQPEEPPLTFGELWQPPSASEIGSTAADPAAPRVIELAMISSDISRNRTVQLPFLETPSPLYVETSILESYFPPSIVKWMQENAGDYDPRVEARTDVKRIPWPQNLPVVFAARLSLSFPVLLSALPLMTPDFAKGKRQNGKIPLRRVWFSDGGLTSNFPVHFFDSPIPARPTFCLNLVDFDAEAPNIETSEVDPDEERASAAPTPDSKKAIAQPGADSRKADSRPATAPAGDPEPGDSVWSFVSVSKGNRFSPAPFTAFDTAAGAGLGSFFSTLLNTARFWSDNQMLIAPGVRDRVVNIALRDDEGGLNLDMSPRVIADLDWRGRAAGLLISARFDPEQSANPETGEKNEQVFANHRWVRFRNFMAAFEDMSRRFARSRRASDAAATLRGESLLNDMIDGSAEEKLGYPAPKPAQPYFRKATDELEQLALSMANETRTDKRATFDRPRKYGEPRSSSGSAPRPKMCGRLRPLVDNDPRSEAADLPVAH
jgi:hypothetical protein